MKKISNLIDKNIIKIIYVTILAQPIIDVMIGVSIKFNYNSGYFSLIRFFILAFYCIYFLCIPNKEKTNKILLFIIGGYFILYAFHVNFAIFEIKELFRHYYFILLLIPVYSILQSKRQKIDDKMFNRTLYIYSIIIVFGFLTSTSFNSYNHAKLGSAGYFYDANAIGNIISLLLPIFIYYKENNNIKKIIMSIAVLGSIVILGTKTPFIALSIYAVILFVNVLKNKLNYKTILLSIAIFLVGIFIFIKSPMYENMKIHLEFLGVDNPVILLTDINKLDHFLFGSRLKFCANNKKVYINSSIEEKLLGVKFDFSNDKVKNTTEMDFFDIFFKYGIVGFLIYNIAIIVFVIKNKIKKINKKYLLSIILAFLISFIVGHGITFPGPATIIAMIFANFMLENKESKKGIKA